MTQAHETQALAERPKDVVERTAARVHEMLTAGELTLPEGYAWRNAITGAWLWLQDATIQSGPAKGQPILKHVTTSSVANALMAMVTQGLAVHRKQGYLIPYGQVLTFQRSVFGTVTIARREAGLVDATAELILEGDTFNYRIWNGRKIVTEHAQSFEALKIGTIVGAYAHLTFTDPSRDRDEVMTWDEIQASWRQSKQAGYDTSPHRRFSGEMAKRTVINRALKLLVNAATDDAHLLDAFNRDDEDADDDLETIDVEAAEPGLTAEQAAEVADVAETALEEMVAETPAEPEPEDDARLFPEDPGF
jgi:recombination protein RecT